MALIDAPMIVKIEVPELHSRILEEVQEGVLVGVPEEGVLVEVLEVVLEGVLVVALEVALLEVPKEILLMALKVPL